jgi:hypothetical protein
MKICLFRTKNGWIIHNDSYFSTSDAEGLMVFGSMKEVCSHLQKVETPHTMPKRLPNGRFVPKTAASHLRTVAAITA